MDSINIIDIINKQKQKIDLSSEEIEYLIYGYIRGEIPDYQMSAFLMAMCFTGASENVIFKMTDCMVHSGETVDLSQFGSKAVDKHSTGGVGDKVTLVVVPCVAACGGIAAKMSGRGLGFTGGTIDKLESIKGFNTELSLEKYIEVLEKVGASVVSAMKNLAPADKKIYALRDITATVDSIPLIAASIMSKKIACGTSGIVLEVTYGNGAFMKTYDDAKELAGLLIKIGETHGRRVRTIMTGMNTPIGSAVGNSLEVIEAIKTLKGSGPKDLTEICVDVAGKMLELSLDNTSPEACRELVLNSLSNGSAFNKFVEMVEAHGGDTEWIICPEKFPKAKYKIEVKANRGGVISGTDTAGIGRISCLLGAGRQKLNDNIDFPAGIEVFKKAGDEVSNGDTLAYLYTNKSVQAEDIKNEYLRCLKIVD